MDNKRWTFLSNIKLKDTCRNCGFPVKVTICPYCNFPEYTCRHCGYDENHCKIKEEVD